MALSSELSSRAAVPDAPPGRVLVGRAFAYWLAQYRRTWRGSAVSSVLVPLGYIAAMGVGLGSLVDARGHAHLGGVGYLGFIAPGLLAATAMQVAADESMYPVMGALKWNRLYEAMLATPLRSADVLAGHLLFVVFRLVTTLTVFVGVMAVFGTVRSWWVLVALPCAVLTGVAYAAPIFAFSARQQNDAGFALLYRFGIVPMFLFSGTFFPVTQLPGWLQPVARVVPLWHGVDLVRSLVLGTARLTTSSGHVAYLLVWVVVGVLLARRAFARRLVT